jgi:hypothetical protein
VWRTCWRAEHRDHIVFLGEDGSRYELSDPILTDRTIGYEEPWLLLGTVVSGKYSYYKGTLRLVDARASTVGVVADDWELGLGAALLADGSVASVSRESTSPDALVLRLKRPGAAPIELDAGSALTALTAHGNTLFWLHDTLPRSYAV